MLSATLLGGVLVTVPDALTTVTAQAAAKIPYSTYTSDISGVRAALGKATSSVQANNGEYVPGASDYEDAYTTWNWPGFHFYLDGLATSVGNDKATKAAATADYECMVATYNVFKTRLSAGARSQLESLASNINQEISASDGSTDFYDILDEEQGYLESLETALLDYGGNYDGVAAKPKAPKSYISKLTAKKTSKKTVKVSGTAKLYKSANYAHIKTYKGYRYAKLSSKHTFSKSINAPKAKTVKVTVGHYSNGHFTAVTSAKTVHVK